ncbi:MAG: N-acetyltransferase, partial [Alphaproteobacteria bacterium]|nr:N-acetyltransferase [Alphaproteobacteria bacterium]
MPSDPAPGKLADVITYLEMRARPTRPTVPLPAGKLAIMRAEPCTIAFYRFLYHAVGDPWLWFERRLWSDERLAAHL